MRSLQCFHIAEFYNYPIAPAHAYVHQFKNRFDAGKTTLTADQTLPIPHEQHKDDVNTVKPQ